jgi:hypothetical protein
MPHYPIEAVERCAVSFVSPVRIDFFSPEKIEFRQIANVLEYFGEDYSFGFFGCAGFFCHRRGLYEVCIMN